MNIDSIFKNTDRAAKPSAPTVTGKIMEYDAETGHLIKHPSNQVSWVHSVRKVPDFHMKQCLFGEYLRSDVSVNQSIKTVAIVESEKTALIAALSIPDFIWLATGGMHGCFNSDAMQVLREQEVILFPDLRQRKNGRVKPKCFNPFVSVLLVLICRRRWRLMNSVTAAMTPECLAISRERMPRKRYMFQPMPIRIGHRSTGNCLHFLME